MVSSRLCCGGRRRRNEAGFGELASWSRVISFDLRVRVMWIALYFRELDPCLIDFRCR